MGLFINQIEHQEVFKNGGEIKAPNQEISKIDPLAELMQQQERAYASLHDKFHILENLVERQNKIQEKESQEIRNGLNELKKGHVEHGKFEDQVLEKMMTLDDKIASVNESNGEIVDQVTKIESSNEKLVRTMNEQLGVQEKLSKQLIKQEAIQQVVSTRLENQEMLTEKVVRQLDYLRSIVYERTHFLIDKIEEGYNLTSAHIYNIMKKPKQPSLLMIEKQKTEEKS